ncbi:hypothetical protein PsYK624_119130 [Phanerochaete sordida]|uniref:Uncharacterized protein n=1 Tax=Phanerochaete sordida TaxID=48140 RepID=A0A9P3LJ07_9APHY|nr:hypothetical protein PsYK624_119130 [Phanerochaete sordida]
MSPPAVAGSDFGRPPPFAARHWHSNSDSSPHGGSGPAPRPPRGLGGGAVAGIVVAVLAVVLGAAAVGIYFCLRARRRRHEEADGTLRVVIKGRHSRLPSMRRPRDGAPRTVLPVYSKFATPTGPAPPARAHPTSTATTRTYSIAFTSIFASTAPPSEGFATPSSGPPSRGPSQSRSHVFAAIDERDEVH